MLTKENFGEGRRSDFGCGFLFLFVIGNASLSLAKTCRPQMSLIGFKTQISRLDFKLFNFKSNRQEQIPTRSTVHVRGCEYHSLWYTCTSIQ
jgi:hypothetical protein